MNTSCCKNWNHVQHITINFRTIAGLYGTQSEQGIYSQMQYMSRLGPVNKMSCIKIFNGADEDSTAKNMTIARQGQLYVTLPLLLWEQSSRRQKLAAQSWVVSCDILIQGTVLVHTVLTDDVISTISILETSNWARTPDSPPKKNLNALTIFYNFNSFFN